MDEKSSAELNFKFGNWGPELDMKIHDLPDCHQNDL